MTLDQKFEYCGRRMLRAATAARRELWTSRRDKLARALVGREMALGYFSVCGIKKQENEDAV
jgi:hypothetical protein